MSIIVDKKILCSKYAKTVSIKNDCKKCLYSNCVSFIKTVDNLKELHLFDCDFAIELMEVITKN